MAANSPSRRAFKKKGWRFSISPPAFRPRVRVFTLDTGRLPAETFRMIETVRKHYGIDTEIVQPDAEEVRSLVALRGRDLFYESVDARRACCDVRKVRPLERKLVTLSAWATGVRREQSELRAEVPKLDLTATPVKLNPLADWTAAQVDEYTRANNVPVHPLYARGYTSVGCAPCTRAVLPGEDVRAGRWWWERDAHKECGIHFLPDGTLRRAS